MTLETFLLDLRSDLEADIGEGELTKSDIEHIRGIVEEKLLTATNDLEQST